jgi:hypothetical protein
MGKTHNNPTFTAATFAQTKFGSTKLKTNAKRPTRLSPTEMGNYFRQQQRVQTSPGFAAGAQSPQRPRSLSPRDPRLEFLVDRQHRLFPHNPNQLSPQSHHGQQGLAHSLHMQQQQPFSSQQYQPSLSFPACSSAQGPSSPGSSYGTSANSGFPNNNSNYTTNNNISPSNSTPWSLGSNDPWSPVRSHNTSPHLSPNSGLPAGFPDMFSSAPPSFNSMPGSSAAGMHSPANSLSPEGSKTFLDGLQQMNNMHHSYPGSLQHLLMAN